jgi:branched-chain amino acid transport system substrate-binding protein
MIALLQEITDTHALGAKATQGLIVTDAFYWDMNDETRAFSKRFNEKVGHMPTMIQAGLYSATMHYLKGTSKNDDFVVGVPPLWRDARFHC